MPSVSVVVPVLNGAATIGAMLAALAAQRRAPSDVEIIVVDNGSTDDTRAVVASFPNVRLLHEARRGPAAARNCGLLAARGEIVVHLDADTLPTRRWLGAIVAPFADPAVTLVVGRTLVFAPQTPVERYIAAAALYDSERAISRPPFPFAPSLNMAVRRTAALAAGGWTAELITAEDVDFSQRVLALYPGPIAFASQAVLFHRTRSTALQLRRLAESYGRGVAHMYERYPERARWDWAKNAVVARRLVVRGGAVPLLALGRALRLVSADRQEFAAYHLLWSWHFSTGFLREYYGRRLRQPSRAFAIVSAVRARVRTPADAFLLCRIGIFLWRAPHELAKRHLDDFLGELAAARPRSGRSDAQHAKIAWMSRAWLKLPLLRSRDSCYLRSLVLYRFLDAGDEPVRLHFGVEERERAGDRRRAHVWVSVGSQTFEGPPPTATPLRDISLTRASA